MTSFQNALETARYIDALKLQHGGGNFNMDANPFKKSGFPSTREWEQELVFFSVEQLHAPCHEAWQFLAVDDETRECAAFMSHHLSNVAYVKRLPSEPALRLVYEKLLGKPVNETDLRSWLARRWLDYSRFQSMLDTALKNKACRLTHRLIT